MIPSANLTNAATDPAFAGTLIAFAGIVAALVPSLMSFPERPQREDSQRVNYILKWFDVVVVWILNFADLIVAVMFASTALMALGSILNSDATMLLRAGHLARHGLMFLMTIIIIEIAYAFPIKFLFIQPIVTLLAIDWHARHR